MHTPGRSVVGDDARPKFPASGLVDHGRDALLYCRGILEPKGRFCVSSSWVGKIDRRSGVDVFGITSPKT